MGMKKNFALEDKHVDVYEMKYGLSIESQMQPLADEFYKEMGFRVQRMGYGENTYSTELQKMGIDCVLHGPSNVTVSEKFRTDDRGDLFVEFISVDTRDVPGWGLTDAAQVLNYFVQDHTVYSVNMKQLKEFVENLINKARLIHGMSEKSWKQQLEHRQSFYMEIDGIEYGFYCIPTNVDRKSIYFGWCVSIPFEALDGKVNYKAFNLREICNSQGNIQN